ncbi:hypothetical protein ATCC90586_000600 [Pythium insidiosum]|nr:hypothetical protein ATCC90586_000600 [Pythium insidiosum]
MPSAGRQNEASHRVDSSRKKPNKPRSGAPHSPSSDRRSSRSTTSSTASEVPLGRTVAISDQRLVSAALDAKRAVQWEDILMSSRMGPSRWKFQETVGDFTIYTRQESQRYAVLAVGVVPCSVAELQQLLRTTSHEDHAQLMDGLFASEFLEGSFVHEIRLGSSSCSHVVVPDSGSRLSQLAVKTATFAKTGWLSNHEEWCYLDAEYVAPSGQSFEKILTTVRPKDVLAGKSSGRSAKFLHNVTMGYKMQAETAISTTTSSSSLSEGSGEDSRVQPAVAAAAAATARRRLPVAVRLQFYAEVVTPKHFGIPLPTPISSLSERATKARLMRVAKRCPRFSVLVRRRRLAHQVLVDRTRRFPLTNARCVMCDKLLVLAKLCRLCGHGVCESCSSKHEREQPRRGAAGARTVEVIRLCARCLDRVDVAEFDVVGPQPGSPMVVPDAADAKPAAALLSDLLQDALLQATSPQKKASVMNVIKCVLSQSANNETPSEDESMPDSVSVFNRDPLSMRETFDLSSDEGHVAALQQRLAIDIVPPEQIELANTVERTYRLDERSLGRTDADDTMSCPVPEDDAARVRVVQDSGLRELGRVDELDIICDIVAKEIGCFASAVTIIDEKEAYVAASSNELFEHQTFPRNESICAHTIMDRKPFMVPNALADVRFCKVPSVQHLGLKFYCGFPLIGENDTVIGAVCCVDQQYRELSASEFAALRRLADTASKVLQIQTTQRRKRSLTSESRSDLRAARRTKSDADDSQR